MLSAAGLQKRKPIVQATVQSEISSSRFLVRCVRTLSRSPQVRFSNGEKCRKDEQLAREASLGIMDVSFQWER